MISQRAKYALRALVALAQAGPRETISIADLATSQSIPKKFLEQILLDLKRHGFVHSRRGQQGGYHLLKNPAEIKFGRVLRIVDGPIALLPCLSKIAYRRCDDCLDESRCEIRRVFAEVAESSRHILDNTSLEDAISAQAAVSPEKHSRRPSRKGVPGKSASLSKLHTLGAVPRR